MADNYLYFSVCSGSFGNFNFNKHKDQNTNVLCHHASIDGIIIFVELVIFILFSSKKKSTQGIKKTTIEVVLLK